MSGLHTQCVRVGKYAYKIKELRNNNQKSPLCSPQQQAKTQKHFNLLFFKVNIHFGRSNQRSTYSKINALLMQSICFVFSSLGMQRRLIQTNVCNELLLFCQKGSHLQTFTSSSLKILFFRRVRCWNKFLRLMFFSPYNNHKALFFI